MLLEAVTVPLLFPRPNKQPLSSNGLVTPLPQAYDAAQFLVLIRNDVHQRGGRPRSRNEICCEGKRSCDKVKIPGCAALGWWFHCSASVRCSEEQGGVLFPSLLSSALSCRLCKRNGLTPCNNKNETTALFISFKREPFFCRQVRQTLTVQDHRRE